MEQKWKTIQGYSNYQISSLGRIRRKLKSGKYHYTTGYFTQGGYKQFQLVRNDHIKIVLVHRLVVEAFRRKIKDDEVCHHKNHIRNDNRLQNLQIMKKEQHDRELVKIENKIYNRTGKKIHLRRMKRCKG